MERQKEYLQGMMAVARENMDASSGFLVNTYEDIFGYIVSDCSMKTLTSLMDCYEEYELKEILYPKGKNVVGEEYMEFYLDEADMEELALNLFYAPKK